MRFKEAKRLNKGLSDKVGDLENSYAKLKKKYKQLFCIAQILAGCSTHQKYFYEEIEKYGLSPQESDNKGARNDKDNN